MITAHDYYVQALKSYDEAKKEWDEHMATPDYCLTTNYFLYKKYMISHNSLIRVHKLYTEYKELQEQMKRYQD